MLVPPMLRIIETSPMIINLYHLPNSLNKGKPGIPKGGRRELVEDFSELRSTMAFPPLLSLEERMPPSQID